MNPRFKDLVKIPKDPAIKQLSQANVVLRTPLQSSASASPEQVLDELETKQAWLDMLMLLAVLLPPRERVWWACLAARDYIGPKSDKDPPSLARSEEWVFTPDEDNREAARATLDHAYVDDETVHCATAVLYADGTLGPGDLAQYPAPAGAAEASVFAMNVVALGELSDRFDEHIQVLIDRALDIARGGSGRVAVREPEKEASR
ncbi:DUF6931 family protein [Sedimentitalea nanhaiensis]|uniref:Uncharacterized protein n=1 Tax=Sedimentitalea nanhaiensis TaxID=999627 RepID=A0A1I7D8E5_9RHOB|nr:hypothetical protein [Sedimentitalea nanhaiensis]SFU07988.1 hypothetical protein SAMN05216236_12437 [Sedimentitalea nanhaiensis]